MWGSEKGEKCDILPVTRGVTAPGRPKGRGNRMREKGAWSREWADMRRQEDAFLERYRQAQAPLEPALRDRVPQGVQDTLEAAFSKAFCVILEKGTPAIEKTLRKEELKRRAAPGPLTCRRRKRGAPCASPAKRPVRRRCATRPFQGRRGLCWECWAWGCPTCRSLWGRFCAAFTKRRCTMGFPTRGDGADVCAGGYRGRLLGRRGAAGAGQRAQPPD